MKIYTNRRKITESGVEMSPQDEEIKQNPKNTK